MFKTIIVLLDVGFTFMSFEFGKFGHCLALRLHFVSDFDIRISNLTF